MTVTLEHQPRARIGVECSFSGNGPSHAYLFRGPKGAGKRAAARAFAAEILAGASEDPEDARRRALLDPSPHPDLVWLAPSGAQHLVEEVRERVIRAAAYRPFEGGKRVFVVEAAEAMRDESQNALLKTLEEPPEFVHLILLSSEPEALLETIASRCQPVDFAPLPAEALEAMLADGPISPRYGSEIGPPTGGARRRRPPGGRGPGARAPAAHRGRAGRCGRWRWLWSGRRRLIRRILNATARPVGRVPPPPGARFSKPRRRPARTSKRRSARCSRRKTSPVSNAPPATSPMSPNAPAAAAGPRSSTSACELCAAWLRDLAAVAAGAEDVAFNRDRLDQLRSQADGLDPGAARRGAEAGPGDPPQPRPECVGGASPRSSVLQARARRPQTSLCGVLSRRSQRSLAPAPRVLAYDVWPRLGVPSPAPAPGPGG